MKGRWLHAVAGAALLLATVSFAQDGRDGRDGRDGGDRRNRLPERAALLGSGETGCAGDLVVQSGVADDGDDLRRVRRGQRRVFEVENENVSWACLGDEGTQSDTMECPVETTHVQIRRDGDLATFECYGRRR